MIRKLLLMAGLITFLKAPPAQAQQYNWANKNGAAASVSANSAAPSVNSLNETFMVTAGASATTVYGAGGVGDIGPLEYTGTRIVKYDADMKLVWTAPVGFGSLNVFADPYNTNKFYMVFSTTGASVAFGSFTGTGQATATTVYLAKCAISGSSFTYEWLRKIDGNSSDQVAHAKLKDMGSGKVRIVVEGTTRSNSISNFTSGSTGVAQAITVAGGGGSVFDYFISCYEDNAGTVTPLWLNTFGADLNSETNRAPLDINDDGDVLFAPSFGTNALGLVNYNMKNNSGGATTTTSYAANITGNRFAVFKLKASDGTTDWVINELTANVTFFPRAIQTDASKNIYLGGDLSGTYAASGTVTATTAGSFDLAVYVYANTASPLRVQKYGNTNANQFGGLSPAPMLLDRTNSKLLIGGFSTASFTAGTASIQAATSASGGYDAFLLVVESTGTMAGVSAVSLLGTVAGADEIIRNVLLRPDGKILANGEFSLSANYRLNAATTDLLPATATGYQDVLLTSFEGISGTYLNPVAQGGFGGTSSNSINASMLQGASLVSAGSYNGTMTIGTTTISGAGTQIVWSDTATGAITDVKAIQPLTLTDMKTAADGSIYIVGFAGNATTVFGAASSHPVFGSSDAVLMKFDASWNLQWKTTIGGLEGENFSGLETDDLGNVYAMGTFSSPTIRTRNTADVASAAAVASNLNAGPPFTADIMIAKYNSSGVLQWLQTGGTDCTAFNEDVAKGLIYMNGYLYFGAQRRICGTSFTFGGSSLASSGAGNSDMVMAKLDPATGNAVWMKQWSGNADESIKAIAMYNNILYVGGTSGSTSGLTLGGVSFVTAGGNDVFVFAVDDAGTEQAGLVQYKGNGTDIINELKADAIGNLFFVCNSPSSSLDIGSTTLATSGGNDWFVGAIDAPSMTTKFGFLSGSAQADFANTITPGAIGMVFVGGLISGTSTFGSTVLNGRLGGDFAFARLDYPYLAPGAQLSTLNTWYKGNTGASASSWTNSTANSTLTTLSNTGTVVFTPAGANFNPSIGTTSTSSMNRTGILSANFTNSTGNQYTVYTVYKPASATNAWDLWRETTTGNGIQFNPNNTIITGTGGAATISKTTSLPTDRYSIDALRVSGTTANAYINGTANGGTTVSALNITNTGTFKVGSTGSMEVAEVINYGSAHTLSQDNMRKVNSYLALKYGITLGHDYVSTTAVPVYRRGLGYDNNIAGLVVDSNDMLIQKQSRSQNIASKGDMLTIGMGTIAASNAANTTVPGAGVSYMVWGDNAGAVTPAINTDLPSSVGACASRLAREWKIKRTGTGITTTQVTMDLNSTAASTASLADLFLMVDRDGDGNFTTGTVFGYPASSFASGVATFNGVTWDVDNNDSDVFALIINSSSYSFPPDLVASAATAVAPSTTCTDNNGYMQFVDVVGAGAKKLAAINTNGNTGFSFTVSASNDSGSAVGHQMKTDGVNTTALMNRMLTIEDAGVNNYPSGMTVRFYYSDADSSAAVAALDPAATGTVSDFAWFKVSGNSAFSEKYTGSVATVLASQIASGEGMSNWAPLGVTLLTPARYGTEGGVKYVDFDNVTSFSTFGAIAKLGLGPVALPTDFITYSAVANNCSVSLKWAYNESEKAVSFAIERSHNGAAYELVKTLNGTETSYIDTPPASGKWMYRIKAAKPGQKVVYTNSIVVSTQKCADYAIAVYPNPAQNELQIVLKGQTAASSFELLDILGKVVMKGYLSTNATNKIDVSALRAGSYTVRITTDTEVSTKQVQIVK